MRLNFVSKVWKVDSQTACQLPILHKFALQRGNHGRGTNTKWHQGLLEATGSSERRAEAMWWQLPVVIGSDSQKVSQFDHFGGRMED